MLSYLSVCSGIEAATVAWHPLGWRPLAFAEIEPFPCAVLKHHYPDVPNLGDLTRYADWPELAPDVVVGGTPCQAFSVAGLRKGLADPRGNLTLTFLGVVDRARPRWVVWENVPGVLSDGTGAFGAFLGGLGELGYGFAYRVLDAQFFGVPQRRRRVFVVGCLGDWRAAAAVLFERHSLSGHPPPRRQERQGIAPGTAPSLTGSGRGVARAGDSRGQDPLVAGTLGRTHGNVRADAAQTPAIAFDWKKGNDRDNTRPSTMNPTEEVTGTLGATREPAVQRGMAVRRLTPRECERLQGFPDDYTLVPYRGKPAADGPRYKALGNSMAVPVMAWIGRRIALVVEAVAATEAA